MYVCVYVCMYVCMYVYIYIYIYIYNIHLFILLINIVPERNEKKKKIQSDILVYLLVAITFSLANCEMNYTRFWCIWGICPI